MVNSVLDYLSESVRRFPERAAYAEPGHTLSYAELGALVRTAGYRLSLLGLRRRPVALLMEKRVDTIALMLSVIASGNFYCPIDIEMPPARIQLILDSLKPAALLYDAPQETLLSELALPEDCHRLPAEEMLRPLSEAQEAEAERVLESIRRSVTDADPLYLLYTSGSTGTPKGVLVSQRVIVNNMGWLAERYRLSEQDVFGNQVPFHFDVSNHDIYGALKFGACTVIIPRQLFMFPIKLIRFLNEYHVSMIFWVPFALSMVANFKAMEKEKPEYLRHIFFAGEVMPTPQLNYWRSRLPEAVYSNMYGPTETYVCTAYDLDWEFQNDEALPIGYPVGNVDFLVLDEEDHALPHREGSVGELCIRGCTLAIGYYGAPELTAERFVQNPTVSYPDRIYRTGDVVGFDAEGRLSYIGRKDFQIKHLGYRIELGEIEAACAAVEGVRYAGCIYDRQRKCIVLIYEGETVSREALEKELSKRLLSYMRPGRIEEIKNMPHNRNGKIDRKALEALYL